MTRPLLRSLQEIFPPSDGPAGRTAAPKPDKSPPPGGPPAGDGRTGGRTERRSEQRPEERPADPVAHAVPRQTEDPANPAIDTLAVSLGGWSEAGAKPANQDFYGAVVPRGAALSAKGIAVAIADGISSSRHGRVAAETAVKSFLTDYYCTSEAWSVRHSASRVIDAANAWLHAETRRAARLDAGSGLGPDGPDPDRGHVTTFSALVLKGRTAHLFHVGDARISRLSGQTFEPLSEDHRLILSSSESYLSKALGMAPNVEIDYRALPLRQNDVFLLTTDGVHEHLPPTELAALVLAAGADLGSAAKAIAAKALASGSRDNLTVQILRVDRLPQAEASEWLAGGDLEPPAVIPGEGETFDGWAIERRLHIGPRSHVYAARDAATGERAALKFLASELRDDPSARRSLLMEEWIAARLSSRHCMRTLPRQRPRSALYTAMELLEGRTLRAILDERSHMPLAEVRRIVADVAKGLQAMHRKEMVHQDLRPENVMIDGEGRAVLVDFGAARVAGVEEARPVALDTPAAGALQFAAPEQLCGEVGRVRSDVFSLGVLTYHMLTGRLPYGAALARTRTAREQRRLAYRPAADEDRDVPDFVAGALRKAVSIDPARRYAEVAEFVHDLSHPNPAFTPRERQPLAMRDPVRFWQAVSTVLAVAVIVLAGLLLAG
ncbi:bifunctional protein-serine/threonine kinase/phosphatase [Jiella pacifica]|uniref:Protein kinase n=1 Tax=Jiella pacifica TaxID=2696469 RepID=A0A6N9T4Q7_9HYPH|nr:bifunctional protein-serine/threonine kinase/phosphatase [Jiella pacifica]NDW06261.1 protein kinase [Jiella pacifica]